MSTLAVTTVTSPWHPETGEEIHLSEFPKEILIGKLREAIDLMNDGGRHWIQNAFVKSLPNGDTGYCSVGALMITSGAAYRREEKAKSLLDALVAELVITLGYEPQFIWQMSSFSGEAQAHVDSTPIVTFNDTSGRTWTAVRSLFESTIERLERDD